MQEDDLKKDSSVMSSDELQAPLSAKLEGSIQKQKTKRVSFFQKFKR
jgi:hypothetical protein